MKTLTQICEDFKISKHVKPVKGPELNLWNENELNTYNDMVNFYEFQFETETEIYMHYAITYDDLLTEYERNNYINYLKNKYCIIKFIHDGESKYKAKLRLIYSLFNQQDEKSNHKNTEYQIVDMKNYEIIYKRYIEK